MDGALGKVVHLGATDFRYTNIGEMSISEITTVLPINDMDRLTKYLPSEGGVRLPRLKINIYDKDNRQRVRRFAEMEIRRDLQLEIDQCLINDKSLAQSPFQMF